MHLEAASNFFGAARDLSSISAVDMVAYIDYLAALSNGRGTTLSTNSQRKYLNSLSNLYRRAQSEGVVTAVRDASGNVVAGLNPVQMLLEKPTAKKHPARWLEIHDAALYLEAARTYRPAKPDIAMPYIHAVVACFLLTGGRESEVMGLEVSDVNFDRETITFRPNKWRRLKNEGSDRPVRLWPQLAPILREHIKTQKLAGGLLFPSVRSGKDQMMVTDLRKQLDAIGERIGYAPGEIRTRIFRHTYCSTRLQTTDNGAPVSLFTVARELGHGGNALVRTIYGHLGAVRHRGEFVEYRAGRAIASIRNVDIKRDYQERLKALNMAS